MAGVDLTESRQDTLRATNIAIVLLAIFFVGLRFTGRLMKGFGMGRDDFVMIVALIFLLGAFSTTLIGIQFGLGKHTASLTLPDIISYAKSLIAFECLYVTCICFTKLSLLLMYMRIFPTKNIRIGAYTLGALSIAWCISIIMVSIFQCTPIEKTWNNSLPGHCINLKGSFIGNAIPNILTDVAILALPMPQVWALHTTVLQKVQLSCVFLLGSFVIFTSIYRFTTLFQFVPADITWTLATAQTWCVVESASGIISACLPTLGPLVQLCTRALGISSTFRSTARSASAGTNFQTIGGTGRKSKSSKNQPSTNFDSDADSQSKGVGPRPFQRLDWEQEWPESTNTKSMSSVAAKDRKDVESMDSDEVPLHRIKVNVRTDVEWKTDANPNPNLKRNTVGGPQPF